jgi:hypothetical protein
MLTALYGVLGQKEVTMAKGQDKRREKKKEKRKVVAL